MSVDIAEVSNYVAGRWRTATGRSTSDVWNPATGDVIARVRTSTAADVAEAVGAASAVAVRAVSFVGSTPAARAVYARAAAGGKRAQAQGGAKNSLVVLPDAPIQPVAAVAAESAFGNAGQRCLAGGSAIVVGAAGDELVDAVGHLAAARTLGHGINVGVAQPMASFPFSGWGDSFFGDLHAHGHHAIEFFTQTKVVVERWP